MGPMGPQRGPCWTFTHAIVIQIGSRMEVHKGYPIKLEILQPKVNSARFKYPARANYKSANWED